MRSSRLLPFALAAALGLSAAPARAEGESRWIAALPFGAGQFQNGDTGLGIFFAAGEALLGATSIGAVVAVNSLASRDLGLRPSSSDMSAVNESIRTAVTVNRIAFTSWAALTVAGIVEAQIRFAPRRRACLEPPRPSITPTVVPVAGGGLLGVRATF